MSFVENHNPQQASIVRSVLLTLVLLAIFCIAWHFLAFMPIFAGMAAMMTGGVWAILIGSVVAYCVIMLLAFVLSGIGLMLIAIFGLQGLGRQRIHGFMPGRINDRHLLVGTLGTAVTKVKCRPNRSKAFDEIYSMARSI